MEISRTIAENIIKHNGIFTFASLAGEDEQLVDYLIEDICSYIDKPILNVNSLDNLSSETVYLIDYDDAYIKENYRKRKTDDRIFTSALIDFSIKSNISFIIKSKLALNDGILRSIITTNASLAYNSTYIGIINDGIFKDQKNRFESNGIYLNIKSLIREDRMKKVLD